MLAYFGETEKKRAFLDKFKNIFNSDEEAKRYFSKSPETISQICFCTGFPASLVDIIISLFCGLENRNAKQIIYAIFAAAKPDSDVSDFGWQFVRKILIDAYSKFGNKIIQKCILFAILRSDLFKWVSVLWL